MIIATGYRRFLFLFFGWFLVTTGFCQLQQPHRFEQEQRLSDDDYSIISLEKEGLALVRPINKYKSGNRTWQILLLDSTLQERKTVELDIDSECKFIGYEYSPGYVHLLYHKNEIRGEFEIFSISFFTDEIERYDFKSELNMQPSHFIKAGDSFIIGGTVNMDPAILLYTTIAKSIKVVPGFFQRSSQLADLRTNQNQTFNAVIIDQSDLSRQRIIFRTFDSMGKQLLEAVTLVDEDINLQNGMSSKLEREDLMILGTWSRRTSKQASGFCILPINPFTAQTINKVYFGQLVHYVDYLKPQKANKIKSKTHDALEKGKIPDFTNYVMLNKVIEYPEGYIVVAESFTVPSSSMNNQSNYSPYSPYWGSPYPSGRQPQYPTDEPLQDPEVKHIQTVAVAFNARGEVLWDFSFKLKDVKVHITEPVSDFCKSGNSIHFLYKKESDLYLKSVNVTDNESAEWTERIKLKNSGDELRSERSREGIVKHWYNNNFYVWGFQTVQNRTGSDTRSKEVFFINKVVVK